MSRVRKGVRYEPDQRTKIGKRMRRLVPTATTKGATLNLSHLSVSPGYLKEQGNAVECQMVSRSIAMFNRERTNPTPAVSGIKWMATVEIRGNWMINQKKDQVPYIPEHVAILKEQEN